MDTGSVQRIPLQVSRQCVVASIQVDLDEKLLEQFRSDLLELLQSSGASGVILDVSGVQVMDLEDFEALRKTMAMAQIMGARTVIAGLQPGVVSALVELGVQTECIEATLNLDSAFRLIEPEEQPVAETAAEEEEPDDTDGEDTKTDTDPGER